MQSLLMKILVVEDDRDMSKALMRALEKRGYGVTACFDGLAAFQLIKQQQHDLILLDLNIPGEDGLHLLQRMRSCNIETPVLVLTARSSVGDRIAGLNAGGDDYLSKPFDLDELEARIKALCRRTRGSDERSLKCGDLRHEPESWTVEIHTVEVYVGTGGDHQDEFLRGKRPKDLLRGSIVTPSLLASILNVKYVNSSALHRVEQEFQRNGVNISRQTMSNWIIRCAEKYFAPFVDRMKQELLSLPVTQSDETPTQVIGDSDRPNSKCYMWVHRSGEFYKERPVVIYEYQKGRDHEKPLEFYRNYKGVLVTDSLEQYHLLDKKLPGVTNANCWAHARRAFADAVKAADKKNPLSVKNSVAYQALQKIAEFYRIDTELKELPAPDRLTQRQTRIKPLVEDFFAWAKQQAAECTVPPKSRTGQGLNFVIHQENYLKVFLTDGDIPIDNSASERAIRTFCIGKKNWMFHNTAKGAGASALVYSISETAKLNNLRPYYYFRYILTELPKYCDEKGNIDPAKLDQLMPWVEEIPEECRKPRRS